MNNDAQLERVVAGVLRRNGQMLLCHRRPDRTSWPDVWDLPGGHIIGGESTAEALVRELDEELGVQVEAPEGPPWMTLRVGPVELDLYLIDRWHGEPRNTALEEHDDIRWFAADDLKLLDLAHPSYIEILHRASAG
jgi:mutator protein MutT